jgi:hypothetical protein
MANYKRYPIPEYGTKNTKPTCRGEAFIKTISVLTKTTNIKTKDEKTPTTRNASSRNP